ncbi:VPLPA-CTERM sorting domain-containing protein [Roseovarius spongiae]|uniref:VPLPA-CTERM sorting domain-containing protein n=1 Tax=Roseovarius spongiae TaxID=2320272 RepID=UPI0011C45D97|nr:VPLPA-CTERM sorting domain-containing protein [Roseovarius spongiae]
MKIFNIAGTIPALALVLSSGAAMAATTFEQGFETDTSGWSSNANGWAGSIQRQDATGLGVTPFEGSYAARFGETNEPGIGSTGPFTGFDHYRDTFPGTYSAQAAIYLDPQWSLGSGFDYSVASSNTGGTHRRDFIFHVTKDSSSGDLLVGGSNNSNFAPREDLETLNNFNVTTAGWYIFEHLFRDDGGTLAVDLNLRDASGSLLFTETRNDPADTIPGVVGGNRYGWFTDITVDGGILVDSTQLNVPAPIPLPAAGWLLLTAFGGLGFAAAQRRRKAA